jgi:diguanylate cyclase (GGDEF)-like protein
VDHRLKSVNHDPTRRFLAEIILVVSVSVVVAMSAVYVRTSSLIGNDALDTARSYTDLIVATRLWNSNHGGVWVLKAPGVATNPYLLAMGVSADATTTDGRVFTLRNPALMTREISQVLKTTDGTSFRLTSLKPVNPANTPDAWERTALVAFQRGATERWETTPVAGVPMLLYMRPLITDASCLPCHARQGYAVGDVRGAVSVMVPLAHSQGEAAINAALLGGLGVLVTVALLAITLGLVRRLRGELDQAQEALVEAATVDVLTNVATRRHAMTLLQVEIDRAARTHEPVALVMVDIDNFKDVNDEHGHAAGDTVLAHVARRIGATLRPYDVFGRIGGEEFLIVAPETDLNEAVAIAERARTAVSASPIRFDETGVTVTVSLGVALVDPSEDDALDHGLARVDTALYDAKAKGRDRTSTR